MPGTQQALIEYFLNKQMDDLTSPELFPLSYGYSTSISNPDPLALSYRTFLIVYGRSLLD